MTFEPNKPKESGPPREKESDRKLGDEWEDWDGTPEEDVEEPKTRFLSLATWVYAIFLGLILLAGYLMKPRVEELPPYLSQPLELMFLLLTLASLVFYLTFLLEALANKRVLPYGWSERMLLWLLPKAVWLGRRMGLSRDRVFNSFIKVNNTLSRSHTDAGTRKKLLILLPRCLSRETRQEIKKLMEGRNHAVATAGGGEEARKAIRKEKPDFIIALACERDLASGIRDVALRVPVIGIPNKRPEGPCKNTLVDLKEFKEALEFFEAISSSKGPSQGQESR